ncbi:MAG: NAD(P)/FAD-dependent oxidoreductase [Paracoccaceae bacterium]
MADTYDFIVIGAGIAGASVAAELSAQARVLLLERESQPGYHTTGRSAAMYAPGYGPQPIRALTRASAGFYNAPPTGFTEAQLLSPRDVIMIAREDQLHEVDAMIDDLSGDAEVSRVDADAITASHPLLRPGYAVAGVLDQTGSDIDVHALHQGYLRAFRAQSGVLQTSAEVLGLSWDAGIWTVQTSAGAFQGKAIINASGAWADQIGQMAGAERIGLVPKRRTALIVDAPDGTDVGGLPLVVDIAEDFYMKPDAGRLLISPANEDPMEPCDAQPEEFDIAYCIDRIQTAFDLDITRIANKWAGLRSFVADKAPVVGYSERAEGFFWLAGQGGYGIQSAPALSRYAAALALGQPAPADILAEGLEPDSLSPARTTLNTE